MEINVLWFSLSPCGSMRKNSANKVDQGWMISLEDRVKQNQEIKLSVAYLSNSESESFKYDGVTYFPILYKESSNPFVKYKNRSDFQKRDDEINVKIKSIVNTVHPDIIHVHGTESNFGDVLDFYQDIPIVISIQGILSTYYEKLFSGLRYDIVKKFDNIYDRIKKTSLDDFVSSFRYCALREQSYLKKAKYIIGRTEWDKNISMLFNNKRKYYVVNEILREQFYNYHWTRRVNCNTFNIVSIVSSGIYKGYDTLLKTAKILCSFANFSFKWLIIGCDETYNWVRITIDSLKINPDNVNCEFLGKQNAENIIATFKNSDLYCHVSHIENSPNSVCEAMICGLPIIASNVGGTNSIIKDKEEGLLYQDGDPYSLASLIVDVKNNYEKSIEIAQNGRIRALNRHNPNSVVSELLFAYNDILNNKLQQSNS